MSRDDRPLTLRRLAYVVLAVIAGVVLSLLAPEDWQPGEGITILNYQGKSAVEAPVTVGSTKLVSFVGSGSGDVEVVLTYDEGLPVDRPLRATISVTKDGERVRPALAQVVLRVELPDGRDELIPISRWNDAEGHLDALRRPPQDSALVLGLLGFVVVLWVTEAFPLFVTSLLIPVVLVFIVTRVWGLMSLF